MVLVFECKTGRFTVVKRATIIVRSRVRFYAVRTDRTSPRGRRLDLQKVHRTRDYTPEMFLNAIIYTYFE